MSGRLAEKILTVTRDAVKAARIEHGEGLNLALKERGRLIGELFGLSEIDGLPEFNKDKVSPQAIQAGIKYKDTFNKIRFEESQLFKILDNQNNKFQRKKSLFRDGRRYIKNTRESIYVSTGKRFDREI